MYWVEVRGSKARRGVPKLVPLDELRQGNWRGFRSVYAYTAEVKDQIIATRSTANLGAVPVYSDELLVDFDHQSPDPLLLHLYDSGVGFELWSSGGKGWHVQVMLEPMFGADVPYSQRHWVAEFAPQADLTFYHQAGQFRLPGTLHEKTGAKKTLVTAWRGDLLEIPQVAVPTRQATVTTSDSYPDLLASLFVQRGEGGRRIYVWHLAMLAAKAGLSYEAALDHVEKWNQWSCYPKLSKDELISKVKEVYCKRTRVSSNTNTTTTLGGAYDKEDPR